ncbi:MAG: hypothetical protein KDB68_13970 [Planctomycetes bacterium]|nr:hypothetical protein [Planctomycetota bacterium]MCA8946799.1 hypothetical protein [Planctomycetota bacterium]
MTERLILSLSYVVPGALIAGLALQVGAALGGVFTTLRARATEQQLPVPPLVRIYFRATMRTLFVTALLFMLTAGADLVFFFVRPATLTAHLLGYSSGLLLLVCGFTLLLQGGVDRHLKLFSARMRLAQSLGGVGGIAAATWGIALITWRGGVW